MLIVCICMRGYPFLETIDVVASERPHQRVKLARTCQRVAQTALASSSHATRATRTERQLPSKASIKWGRSMCR